MIDLERPPTDHVPVSAPRGLLLRAGAELVRDRLRGRLPRRARLARRHREAFHRDLWSAAAARVGAPARDVGGGALEIDLGARRIRVRGAHVSVDDRAALARAGDKALVYRLLADDALPVPRHRVISLRDLPAAQRFLAETAGPCVVKPARNGSGGHGVTTGVRTAGDLRRAAVAAAAAGGRGGGGGSALSRLGRAVGGLGDVPLLVEHQHAGIEYRLLLLDGVLVDALRREPPSVVGDGRRTVDALRAELNARRLRAGGSHAQHVVGGDLEYAATLAAQGLRPSTVPAPGTVVRLKTAINENAPEDNIPARDELCPAIVAQAARAAALVGVRLAGIDIIAPDPSVPLGAGGGVLLEVNTTPGLAIHQNGHPAAVEPATEILRRLAAT